MLQDLAPPHSQWPRRLCLVHAEGTQGEALAVALSGAGIAVKRFAAGDASLVDESAFDFDFYVVVQTLPAFDGSEHVRRLRQRTKAGAIVVSPQCDSAVFRRALQAGADLCVPAQWGHEAVLQAVQTVARRSLAPRAALAWVLAGAASTLTTPLGVVLPLLESDVKLLGCFVDTGGESVTREHICERLGRTSSVENHNTLHATVYRLRRRIEQTTQETLPLQSRPRVGYYFRGQIVGA